MTTTLLDAALAYAAAGWPVFPCTPGGKTPLIPKADGGRGVLDATTDHTKIIAWWDKHPTANIGIATGTPGPDVLDIDVKPDGNGYEALGQIMHAGLIAGHLGIVRTPSGGSHIYFTGSKQRNGSIRGKYVDYRGAGGYVIAPHSHIGGVEYTKTHPAEGDAQADWRAIRALLDPPPDPPQFQQPKRDLPGPREDLPGAHWAQQTSWADILSVNGWRMTRDLGNGRALWCRPGKTFGTSATTREDGGLYVFSSSTEFDVEVPYTKFGALAVLEHAGDHTAAARKLRELGYGHQPQPLLTVVQQPPSGQEDPTTAELEGLPEFDLGALAERGITEPKRIAHGMLYPGSVHALAGTPGGGKTTLMAWWMLSHIREGGHVMLLDEESGPDQAAGKFLDLGATPDELRPPHFTYIPFPARNWSIGDIAQLHALIQRRQPAIISWDSAAAFLAIANLDENSAPEVTRFWQRVLVPCARTYGAAVVAIDHTGKGEHGGYGRGSGAKKAASDVQYIIETIKPFNRKQNGILRLTTQPGKDRQGWLAMAYEIHVKTGDTLHLDITEASAATPQDDAPMKPAKRKLLEALNAIASEDKPATISQLVDWVSKKHGHGLRRPTCSTYLNELAADGLADSVTMKAGHDKFWYPTLSASDDASSLTRLSASAPPIGADTTADTLTPSSPDTQPLCRGCGERHNRYGDTGTPCYANAGSAS